MPYVTKFSSYICPFSLTSFSWFSDYLKKVMFFCNVNFFLSIRITIWSMCVPCKVLMPVRQFSLNLDLISWITEQGGQVHISNTISNRSTIFGVWNDCKVYMPNCHVTSDLDLIFMVKWSKLSLCVLYFFF